jgi:hypothetical protein
MRPTISPTVQYLPSFRSPIISRRFASAIALKTSVVVAALAMGLRAPESVLKDEGLPFFSGLLGCGWFQQFGSGILAALSWGSTIDTHPAT